MTVLKELAKQAIRYGLKPEDIGPISTFTDLEYMKAYIGHLRGFEAPASYGVSAVHRERAASMAEGDHEGEDERSS